MAGEEVSTLPGGTTAPMRDRQKLKWELCFPYEDSDADMFDGIDSHHDQDKRNYDG